MVSNTLLISQLTNGEAENNLHKQSEKNLCRSSNRRQAGVRSVRLSGDCTHVNEESLDISGATTRDSAGTSNSNMHPDVIPKGGKRQNDMILEDMYNKEHNFDDDDDDSDWDPLEKNIKVLKWFCVNCTMVNFDDVVQCDVCGEHRESGILRHGFFASSFLAEGGIDQNGSLLIERCKELCSRNAAPNNSTVVGFDERMLLHAEVEMKSHPHPERPDRLRAIAASLATAGIFPGRCSPVLAREITREELLMIHSTENVEAVELASRMLASYFTPDTYANEHSALAARLAAGLCADLASAIFSGRAKNGFALVRPPGHHAGVKEAMGFCLHNNAAIAASAAQVAGAKKVLIVDWDVHHGNGTQEIFDQIKSVLYVSLHRHEGGKFYPGTGAADEVGGMGAEGYCVNIPWSCRGVGDKDYIYAFQHVVIPIASEFAPDFIIISAGFDAARGDPLGCCDVTPAGFAQMTEMLSALSGGKLLVILEGGYNLRSISSSATAVIKVLLGENPACNLDDIVPSKSGLRTILEVLKIQSKFWPALESTFSKLQLRWGVYAFQDTVSNFADPLSSRNLVRRRRQRDEGNAGPSKKHKSSSGSAPATSSSAPAPPPSSSSAPASSSIFIPSTGAPTTTAGNIVDFFRPGFDWGTSRAPKGQGESGRHGRGKQLEVLKAQRESTLGLPEILGQRPLTSGAESPGPIVIPQWNLRVKDRAEESSISRELLQKANLPEDIKFVKSMDLEKLCNRIAVSMAMTCAMVAELFRRAQELEKTRETAVAELEKQLKEAEQAKHELKVRFEEAEANRVNALKAREEAFMELQATMKSLTSAHAEELKRLKEIEEAKLQAAREEAVKAFQGSCQFTAIVQTIREEARKEAVKDFRASDEFAKDLLLLSTPTYLLGFTDAIKTMSSIMYNHQIKIMEEHESYYPGIEKLVDLLAEGFKKGEDLVKIKEDFEVEQAKASPPSLLAPVKEPSKAPTAEEPIIKEPPTAKEPP